MSRLDPEALQRSFIGWMQAVVQVTAGEVIAIDGKTLRRSFDTATRKAALHMVSAWGCANGVVLGQLRTSEKSNEITAIPSLLELLDVRGCIVTIDAMGCQRAIAEQIRAKRGHYVLAVKENQRALLEDIRDYFEAGAKNGYGGLKVAYHEETDSGHGRIEVRRCWQSADLRWMPATRAWAGAKSVPQDKKAKWRCMSCSDMCAVCVPAAKIVANQPFYKCCNCGSKAHQDHWSNGGEKMCFYCRLPM